MKKFHTSIIKLVAILACGVLHVQASNFDEISDTRAGIIAQVVDSREREFDAASTKQDKYKIVSQKPNLTRQFRNLQGLHFLGAHWCNKSQGHFCVILSQG